MQHLQEPKCRITSISYCLSFWLWSTYKMETSHTQLSFLLDLVFTVPVKWLHFCPCSSNSGNCLLYRLFFAIVILHYFILIGVQHLGALEMKWKNNLFVECANWLLPILTESPTRISSCFGTRSILGLRLRVKENWCNSSKYSLIYVLFLLYP